MSCLEPYSCQNINGDVYLNKCLLGYVLDGKNRLIVVKNEKGEIVTRAVMRILWDEKEKTPVLFKERMYSRPSLNSKIIGALDKMFDERSAALHLPLITSEDVHNLSPYPNPIYSLAGKAPFEYVDATSGITNGTFTIKSSSLIRT